jgi:hypothetical protein
MCLVGSAEDREVGGRRKDKKSWAKGEARKKKKKTGEEEKKGGLKAAQDKCRTVDDDGIEGACLVGGASAAGKAKQRSAAQRNATQSKAPSHPEGQK